MGPHAAHPRFDEVFWHKSGIELFIERLSILPSSKARKILKLLVQAGHGQDLFRWLAFALSNLLFST